MGWLGQWKHVLQNCGGGRGLDSSGKGGERVDAIVNTVMNLQYY